MLFRVSLVCDLELWLTCIFSEKKSNDGLFCVQQNTHKLVFSSLNISHVVHFTGQDMVELRRVQGSLATRNSSIALQSLYVKYIRLFPINSQYLY